MKSQCKLSIFLLSIILSSCASYNKAISINKADLSNSSLIRQKPITAQTKSDGYYRAGIDKFDNKYSGVDFYLKKINGYNIVKDNKKSYFSIPAGKHSFEVGIARQKSKLIFRNLYGGTVKLNCFLSKGKRYKVGATFQNLSGMIWIEEENSGKIISSKKYIVMKKLKEDTNNEMFDIYMQVKPWQSYKP